MNRAEAAGDMVAIRGRVGTEKIVKLIWKNFNFILQKYHQSILR